ncbi:MAG: adenylate/guanylate cyclase domain-containing protein [Bradyrhizobium sp.]|nr:adenylate/guanylate cyclase domain-containing protein [Bradyrhizobium sp.]
MIISYRERVKELIGGIGLRQIRLACGLVLFSYLVSHFLNHALGNISIDALEFGVHYHILFWQFLPVAIILYTAAILHAGLGIWALYQRREFRWKRIEPLQLVLGLSIPLLVIVHIVGVRLAKTMFGHQMLYAQELYKFWLVNPGKALQMSSVLIIAWVHGCIGLHFWLRMKAFYRRAAPFLLAAAVLIPTLALLGFYQGARSVTAVSQDPQWRAQNLSEQKVGTKAQQEILDAIIDYSLMFYLALLGLALFAKAARELHERRSGMITLSYGNGRTIRVPKGLSVLEASLRHNVPHASVCGGRARCSTCRIRVIGDYSGLPEPSPREAFVLNRVGAADPSIRLACQLRPTADLAFFQLFAPSTASATTYATHLARGQERYLVSLFVDMRGSTRLAEKRLPFDTVFIVNRFLAAVSQAVIQCGGQPNQFVGDGMLALFGLSCSAPVACRDALRAVAMIAANIEEFNESLAHDLNEPIRFGVGVHGGEVIVGDIGYRDHMVFTALGDAVNVAARLQELSKSLACEAIVSEEVCARASVDADDLPRKEVEIRGRAEPMLVRAIASAKTLLALVEDVDAVAA